MECFNTRNVVLMHPILTPGAVTNERPGKWSCDKINLRVHQGSKVSAPTQILFFWCTQFWPQVLWKSAENKLFFTRRFLTTSQQMFKCSILRPLLSSTFPQGFRITKNFGHPTLGSGVKIGLKINVWKGDKQTNRQTHRHTHTQIIRLLDRIGPVGRFYENPFNF